MSCSPDSVPLVVALGLGADETVVEVTEAVELAADSLVVDC